MFWSLSKQVAVGCAAGPCPTGTSEPRVPWAAPWWDVVLQAPSGDCLVRSSQEAGPRLRGSPAQLTHTLSDLGAQAGDRHRGDRQGAAHHETAWMGCSSVSLEGSPRDADGTEGSRHPQPRLLEPQLILLYTLGDPGLSVSPCCPRPSAVMPAPVSVSARGPNPGLDETAGTLARSVRCWFLEGRSAGRSEQGWAQTQAAGPSSPRPAGGLDKPRRPGPANHLAA